MKKFRDLEYTRPDFAGYEAEGKRLLDVFKSASDFANAKKAYDDINNVMNHLDTMATIASIRNTANLEDKFYEEEILYIEEESAKLTPLIKKMNAAFLSSRFRPEFEKEYGLQCFRQSEAQNSTICNENIPLLIEESQISNEYSKAVAVCKTDFRGETCNFYGLLKHMESTDREERREAFEKWAKLYQEVSPKLDGFYDTLVQNRIKQAKNLGFDSYIDMIYLKRNRFDYNAADVSRFRSYVAEYITPLCAALVEKQRERLGVDRIYLYDEQLCYPEGNPTPHGTTDEKIAAASRMYHELSAETGEFFDFMVEHELFDLETRPGKHMGGYCTFLSDYKAPFIFSNFNGTAADVDVLTHEAGHAFEIYLSSRIQPLPEYYSSTSEINEIHSMTMEHFTYPWMKLFFGEDTDHRIFSHLFGAICCIPYLVCVDEFQHKVFENPDMTHEERMTAWRNIEKTYMPWRAYDGNEFLENGGYWMQKQHIFLYPFYYIDYALAQMCAFQLYMNMEKDKTAAWNSYLTLCKLGGSLGYFELLEQAGLKNPFDRELIKNISEFIKKKLG